MPLVEKDFEDGMDFGVGINDVNGDPLGQATTRQTIVSPGGTGQTASFRMDMVQSLDDLHKQLGL